MLVVVMNEEVGVVEKKIAYFVPSLLSCHCTKYLIYD